MLFEVKDLKTRQIEARLLSQLTPAEIETIETFLPPSADIHLPNQGSHSDALYLLALEYMCVEMRLALATLKPPKIDWSLVRDRVTELQATSPMIDAIAAIYSSESSFSLSLHERIRCEVATRLTTILVKFEAAIETREAAIWRLISNKNLTPLEKSLFVISAASEYRFCDFVGRDLLDSLASFSIENLVAYGRGYFKISELRQALAPGATLLSNFILDPDLGDLKFEWHQVDFALTHEIQTKIFGGEERSEIIEITRGYRVIEPPESLADVILPAKTMKRLRALIDLRKTEASNEKAKQKLTLLLTGVPGSGKSLVAKAVAKELGSKALVIQLSNKPAENLPKIAALFNARAKQNGYVLVFEECEDLFGRNRFTGKSDGWAKLMFEEFEGVAIFTTNYDLPPAMDRRMSMIIRLKAPNRSTKELILRKEILKIENQFSLKAAYQDSTLNEFTRSSGISGGYYKQILEMAAAQSKDGHLHDNDLQDAFEYAKENLNPSRANGITDPRISLTDIELSLRAMAEVGHFIDYAKDLASKSNLSALMPQGATALFEGPPGSGKTITAEAIACELGLGMKRVSPSDLLSKWVGGNEENIRNLFQEAEEEKHLLFIDEAEGLFASRENARASWERTQSNELLQQVENFKGTLVIATNFKGVMDPAFARRFLFQVHFAWPEPETRLRLWKKWQQDLSLENDAVERLALKFELSGGEIRNAAVRAKATKSLSLESIERICELILSSRTGEATRSIRMH